MSVVSESKFTVPRSTPRRTQRDGPLALAKVYRKFSKPMPEILANSAPIRATSVEGDVSANPEQFDSEYLCPVTIGGQTLNLDFDTGSADLWVFSNSLGASSTKGHTVFDPSKSNTFKTLSGAKWNISYGDGSGASGTVGTDSVDVGGATVKSQAVELATKVAPQFVSDVDSDGLLGLAFSSINTVTPTQQKTFFDNISSSLDQPIFTADLPHNQPGTYDFGFIDDSKYTGTIEYTSVDNSQGFWGFTADGYAVGDGSVNSTSIQGIADTGTSLLLLPDAVVSAYYDQVSGAKNDSQQGGYTVPANATLPDFKIAIGNYTAVIPGSLMSYAPVSNSTNFGALQSSTGVGISIFGDVFFKSTFVVFDGGNTQLGFAAKPTTSS